MGQGGRNPSAHEKTGMIYPWKELVLVFRPT